ncbi:hypothetical protein, partial [Streptomyces boncukensis]|uniref:hypothetical protein n=1 Tax=Streptomyces boncukensis TaxID=2711219 RepID=UPI0019D3021C
MSAPKGRGELRARLRRTRGPRSTGRGRTGPAGTRKEAAHARSSTPHSSAISRGPTRQHPPTS